MLVKYISIDKDVSLSITVRSLTFPVVRVLIRLVGTKIDISDKNTKRIRDRGRERGLKAEREANNPVSPQGTHCLLHSFHLVRLSYSCLCRKLSQTKVLRDFSFAQ